MENEGFSKPLDDMGDSRKGEMVITSESANYLNETGKWSKFLAIIGFILVAVFVGMGLFAGTIFSTLGQEANMPFPSFLFGAIYIGMGVLYFFPVYYLFNFATHVAKAFKDRDSRTLNQAFANLKSHYKFIGILTAIGIGFYVLGIFIALMSSLM